MKLPRIYQSWVYWYDHISNWGNGIGVCWHSPARNKQIGTCTGSEQTGSKRFMPMGKKYGKVRASAGLTEVLCVPKIRLLRILFCGGSSCFSSDILELQIPAMLFPSRLPNQEGVQRPASLVHRVFDWQNWAQQFISAPSSGTSSSGPGSPNTQWHTAPV